MVQIARPDSDVSAGSWTLEGSAAEGTIWESLDEVSANDGVDYIESAGGDHTCEVGLANVTDPAAATGHVLRARMFGTGSGGPERLIIALFEGVTQRAISGNLVNRDSWGDVSYTLTAGEADSIGDYTNLSLRLISDNLGGAETMWVTQAFFEVPDAGPTTETINVPAAATTITGQAPGVLLIVPVPAGSTAITGFAPTAGEAFPIPAAAITLAGQAPTLLEAIPVPAAAITLTGQIPSHVLAEVINVPNASITITGFAATVGEAIPVPAASVSLTGFAPGVDAGVALPFVPGIAPVSRIKPQMWALNPAFVAPEWRWFWEAKFLAACWEGSGQLVDLITGDVSIRFEGAGGTGRGEPAWDPTTRGLARRHQGTTGGANTGVAERFANNPAYFHAVEGEPYTIATFFIPQGSNTESNFILSKGQLGVPFFNLYRNNTGVNDDRILFEHTDGFAGKLETPDNVVAPGVPSTIVVRRGIGGVNNTDLIVDGVIHDSANLAFFLDNAFSLQLGRDTPSGNFANQQLLWLGHWDKAWTDAQVRQIDADPYGPFQMALTVPGQTAFQSIVVPAATITLTGLAPGVEITEPGTLIPGISPVGLIKPPMWAISRRNVAPEWQWFWEKPTFLTALWEGAGPARDLVTGEVATRTEGAGGPGLGEAVWEPSTRGLARRYQGRSTSATDEGIGDKFTTLPPSGFETDELPWTIACYVTLFGTNSGANFIFGTGGNSGAGALSFQHNSNFTSDGKLAWFYATSFGIQIATGVDFVVPGTPYVLVATHRAGAPPAGLVEFYINGVLIGTENVAEDFGDEFDLIGLGQSGEDGNYSNQQLHWAGLWRKTWGRAQVQQLSKDPFGPFRIPLDARGPPTVVVGDQTIGVPAAAITITGQAPTLGEVAPVPAASITLAGQAPTLVEVAPVPSASITLTGFAPGALISYPVGRYPNSFLPI